MTRTLPALHEGHAPFHLHQAFSEALDAYEEWDAGQSEPGVEFEGALVPISAIFGRMRTCFDLLPSRVDDIVRDVAGKDALPSTYSSQPTYAEAALILRGLCVDRLRSLAA